MDGREKRGAAAAEVLLRPNIVVLGPDDGEVTRIVAHILRPACRVERVPDLDAFLAGLSGARCGVLVGEIPADWFERCACARGRLRPIVHIVEGAPASDQIEYRGGPPTVYELELDDDRPWSRA